MSDNIHRSTAKPGVDLRILLVVVVAFLGCSKGPGNGAKLPLGWFDVPVQNAAIKGTTILAGWALSEDGIADIEIYVDRVFLTKGKVSGARPDVVRQYPEFASVSDIEWNVQLETAQLAPGVHNITARAISKVGAIRDLGTVVVTVER
jgi:Bacterial Ig domain